MNNKDKSKILYVKPWSGSSFIKNDEEILNKYFNLVVFDWSAENHPEIKIFKILMKEDIDLIFMWFAARFFAPIIFLSKLFRVPTVVVVGGYDVAFSPEINYGQFTLNWYQKIRTKYVLKNADMVLPVSNFTKNEVLEKVKPKKLKVVYNGIDIEKFKPSQNKKEKMIATIGKAIKQKSQLKGLETFAKVSLYFPDYQFVIIGATDDITVNELKKINPNLIFTGHLARNEISKYLQRAKIYCQLSYRESFGIGNAEAMSCGCIPVVTDRSALPEIVGNIGFYVPYDNENATVNSIKQAIATFDERTGEARKRIENNFSLKTREKQLREILIELLH